MSEKGTDLDPENNKPPGIDAYLTDVFDRRLQGTTLRQILGVFPEADRSALISQVEALARRLDSLVEERTRRENPCRWT